MSSSTSSAIWLLQAYGLRVYNMRCMLGFLLHVLLQVFCMILNPAWSFPVDILVIDDLYPECRRAMICTQNCSNDSSISKLTWTLHLSDEFALAKYVSSLEGQILYKSTFSSRGPNYFYSPNTKRTHNGSCYFNCSKLIREVQQKRVFIQSILRPTRDTWHHILHDIINQENHIDTMVRCIQMILSREKWNSYVILASDHEEIMAVASRFKFFTNLQMFTVNRDLNNSLERIYTRHQEGDLNLIVVASSGSILTILQQAYALESKTIKTSRLLLVPADESIGDILQRIAEIKTSDVVVLELLRYSKYYPVLDIITIEQQLSKEENMNDTMYSSYVTKFKEEFSRGHNTSRTADMFMVHKANDVNTLHKSGYIDAEGLVLTDELFPGGKCGFYNRTLIVAVLPVHIQHDDIFYPAAALEPYVMWPLFVSKKDKNGSVVYSGLSVDLINELSLRLNFRYVLVEPEDEEWGRIQNGKWTGMVKLLLDKKVDMALGPLAIEAAREKVIDFSLPYSIVRSAVLFKKPDINGNKWKTLLAPFRYEVFICILISILLSSIFLFIMEEGNPINQWTHNGLSDRLGRFGDILWYHFGALVANGGAYLPRTPSGRTVLSCWWLFTLMSAAIYSGNLIAFLTDWREKPPFSTLQEMVEQDAIKWGTMGGSSYVILFQNSNRSEYKKIWQGLDTSFIDDPDVMSTNIDVHLRKVLGGQYAFMSEVSQLGVWQTKYCDLQMLHEEFFVSLYAIGLQEGSACKDIISDRISKIFESGLLNKWRKKWMPENHCEKSMSAKRVDLLALQSAFYAAGIGVFLAVLVLIAEILVKRIRTFY